MQIRQFGQELDQSQSRKYDPKRASKKRLILFIIVLLVISVSTTIWILNILGIFPGSWIPSTLSALFLAGGTTVALLQYLLPVPSLTSSSTEETSSQPPLTPHISLNRTSHGDNSRKDWEMAPSIRSFYGREKELVELKQWIVEDHCQLIAVLGIGGIGKTYLTARLVEQIKDEFEYVFWRPLKGVPPLKLILRESILHFSGQQHFDFPDDENELITMLIPYLHDHRCLFVLDNVEAIMQVSTRPGQYRNDSEGYGKLIQRVGEARENKSCLLLTSREKPKEVIGMEGPASTVRSLSITGLSPSEGQALLKEKGLSGTEDRAVNKLIDLYRGNPLALVLVAEPIRTTFGGDIDHFLKEGKATMGNIDNLLDEQFHRLSAIEKAVMYWLAIEFEAVSMADLRGDLIDPVLKGDLPNALNDLQHRSMIEINNSGNYLLQPVILEYVVDRFVELMSEELETEILQLFASHALMKAQSKDYIRESQVRLILRPVGERLLYKLGRKGFEEKCKRILSQLRTTRPQQPGYAAGNILNLLIQLNLLMQQNLLTQQQEEFDLSGFDFSYLAIWQAYLQGISLFNVNFDHATFTNVAFTDTFGGILSVTCSPAGNLLAAGTANNEIRLWDASGSPIRTLEGHEGWVRSIAFSPDGRILASGSEDETVRLWDVESGQRLNILEGHTTIVSSVAFSPDGRVLASADQDSIINLWDYHAGTCVSTLKGHGDIVWSVAFSHDSKILASGSEDNTVRLWDIDSGQCLKVLRGLTSWVYSVAFSPDGRILASGSEDKDVRLWDVESGQCFKTLKGHTNTIWSVTFNPDGKTLVSGSGDQTIRMWEVSDGRCVKSLHGYRNAITSVAFNSDGQTLASGCEDRNVRLWNINKGTYNTLDDFPDRIWSVAFNFDSTKLANSSVMVYVWDPNTKECLKTLTHHTWVYAITFSPDGKTLASCDDDGWIYLWEWDANSRGNDQLFKSLPCQNDAVWSVAFSPNGNLLASGSETVCIWDTSNGRCLETFREHSNSIRSVAFSPNGKFLASGSEDNTVRLWDVESGQCSKILKAHTDMVTSVAFSIDGKILASASQDRTIKLWNVRTWRCLRILKGHDDIVWSVAFSPDENTLASGSEDGTIKRWNIQTGECVETLRSNRPYEGMNIAGVKGFTPAQKAALKALGAVEG